MILRSCMILLVLMVPTACGSLSGVPWPDIQPPGDAGDAQSAEVMGPITDGHAGTNPDVGQTPPTGTWLTPVAGTVVELATPVTFTAQVASPYVAAQDLFLDVTLASGPVAELPPLQASEDGKLTFTLSTLPPGPQTLVLRVMDGANPATEVALALYVDSPPGTPTVAIAPNQPHSNDDLTVQVTVPAADLDPGEAATQTYGYQWLLEDVPTDANTSTLPAARTEPGQHWTVRVRAWDDLAWGPPGQASVLIGNVAPVPPQVEIVPQQPTVADLVQCAMPVAATDSDGQNLAYKIAWTKNGKPFEEAGAVAQLQLAKDGKPLLPVHTGDVLTCQVLVTDGMAIVGPVEATAVTLGPFDGCQVGPPPCGLSSVCSPTDTAAVTCTCQTGYAGDGQKCLDVDECLTQSPCALGADCTNTLGSYTCTCEAGYTQLGLGTTATCADIDECGMGTSACDLNADCTNTVGGYGCACKNGWSGDGFQCIDVDACLLGLLQCDAHATCANLPGADTCTCDIGWTGDGASCLDVDECADLTPTCGTAASCTNTPGSFDCTCKPGYSGDGTACTDVDECNGSGFICAPEATCQNLPGTYGCLCGVGYVGDGKQCDDVDECAVDQDICDAAATCINEPGGYQCACKPGWVGDGKTCKPEVN